MRNKIASVSKSYKCLTVKGRKEKGAEWQVDGLKGFIICLFVCSFDKMRKVEHEYSKWWESGANRDWNYTQFRDHSPCGKEWYPGVEKLVLDRKNNF